MPLFSSFPWLRRFASGFAFVAVALILMTPLAACGGGSSPGSSSTSSGPVSLTYWSWIPGMDKQVALFNKAHPDIHIYAE
jgi:multiple sugar transport system substrate-binding protein